MAKQVTPPNPYSTAKTSAIDDKPKKPNPYAAQFKSFIEEQDKSIGYDEEVIDEVGAGDTGTYAGLQKIYSQKSADAFDAYEDYVDRNTLHGGQFNFDDFNRIRANNQSNWEKAGHAVERVAVNIIPQIISGFASMLDIPGYFSAEEAANNTIVNWAQDLKKEVDEDWFPIYERNPGKSMQLNDFGWWMSRGSGLVESIGSFLAQGYGAGKIASMTLKGISTASKAKYLARALMGAEKSKQVLGATNALTTATMLNQSEAVIEATQVFKDTYDDRLAKGYDYASAKKAAAEAAATTMNINKINILLNLTSASRFLTPIRSTRSLIKPTNWASNVKTLALEGTQEGAEELVNLAASKAGMAKGRGESYSFQDALDDIGTMEGVEAAFLGAIGGIAQTGGTTALKYSKYGPGSVKDEAGNRISFMNDQKTRFEKQQQIIKEMEEKGVKMTDTMMNLQDTVIFEEKIRAAEAKGDTAEVERLQQDRFEAQALKAFESGTTETLENLYEAEAQRNPDEVGAEYVAKAKKAVQDLRNLEAVYNNFEDYENVTDIFYNRANKIRVDNRKNFIQNLSKEADFELSQHVNTIAKNYKFEREQEVLFKKDGVVEKTEIRKTEVPLTYSTANLEDNTGDTEHNKAVYNKFLEEVQKLDSYKKATEYKTLLENAEKQEASLSQEFSALTSKEAQAKAAKQKAEQRRLLESYTALQKASTLSEIDKIASGIENEAFTKAVELRKQEIQTALDAAAKTKKTDAVVTGFNARIKNANLEDLDAIQDEIKKAELSDTHKSTLLENLDRKARLLNNAQTEDDNKKNIDDEETNNALGGFDTRSPEEIEAEIAQQEKDAATEIPTELPNPRTEKETIAEEVTDTAEKLLQSDDTNVIGEDENGNLIYNYGRSENAYDHGAYLSREFEQTEEDGVVTRAETTDEITALKLLDPDFLTPGTELVMEVDTEFDDSKYDAESTTRAKIPWSTRLEQIKQKYGEDDFMNSEEYINEVPIKVTANGETVFYVHDNAWYREENLNNTPEGIQQNKDFNRQIREKIIKSKQVKTKVSSKSFGKLFKSADGKSISVSEAMPDENLILAVGKDGAVELSGDTSKILGKGGKLLPTTIKDGRLYAIVKVGPNEFLPIPLERQPITEEIADTVLLAIEAHLTNDKENPVVKAIQDNNGLDITDLDDLRRYVSQFIYLYPTAKGKGLKNVIISQGGDKSTLKSNMPLISITATGIEFGKPGMPSTFTTISQNFENTARGKKDNANKLPRLEAILKSGNILANANRKAISQKRDVAIVTNKNGETRTIKYTEFLKESYKTNIRAINIGTKEEPKWAYTIQPTITFDTAFAGIDPTAKPKAVSKKPATVTKTAQPKTTTTSSPLLDAKKAELVAAEAEVIRLVNEKRNDPTLQKAIKDFNAGKITVEQLDAIDIAWRQKNGLLAATIKVNQLQLEIEELEKSTTTPTATEPKETVTELEAKIADIEKRRTESIVSFIKSRPRVKLSSNEEIAKAKEELNKQTTEINDQYDAEYLEAVKKGEIPKDAAMRAISSADGLNRKAYAELAALEETEESTIEPTVAEEVEDLVGEARIESYANELLESIENRDQLEGVIENLEGNVIAEEDLIAAGFESYSEALATYQRALEIYNERASKSTTIKFIDGSTNTIDGNTKDSAPIDEDSIDESIVPMTAEQVAAQRLEIEDMIIRGLSPEAQQSLISYLASTIMREALNAVEKGGTRKVAAGPILAKHLETFKELSRAYKDAGLKNNAARIDAIIDQFEKVKRLVNQHVSLFTIGRVEENFIMDDNIEATGLEKVVYTDDWAFTINSKTTASADLKQFFTNIQAQDENGPINNPLGWPEMLSYDTVMNTCQELLANKPADYKLMTQILELHTERFPWLRSVIDQLNTAPDRIKNEFVSNMAKHHVDMQFVMWSKDNKGRYSLQRWSSNSSSIEQRLRNIWSSNLKGVDGNSNLITVNADNEYVFNKDEANRLIDQATEFAMKTAEVTNDELAIWLANFGIIITDETYQDLRNGKYNNQGRKSWNNLFNHSAGLVRVLAKQLETIVKNDLSLADAEILNDTAVKALAKLDAANTLNVYSNSFQAGGKTIYSYGNNNFLVNRMRDITAFDYETGKFVNQELINNLQTVSFTRDSIWLEELTNDELTGDATKRTLQVGYLSLEALKKKYSASQDNRKLNNLSPAEHEVTKLGLFFNKSGLELNGESRRVVNFFYPTMSDKSTMLTIQALARQLKLTDGQLSQEGLELLYRAMVNPEIDRIRGKQADNIKGYEPNYFYLLPSLNELMISVNGIEKSFLDIVKDKNDLLFEPQVKEAVLAHIAQTFNTLVDNKLNDWQSLGIGVTLKDKQGRITDQFAFLDKEYMSSVPETGKGVDKVKYAAMDFVFNYLIANAEACKLFAGDPALYAKFKTKAQWAKSLEVSADTLTDSEVLKLNLKETFTNMGKRLAGDIAPGLELANSTTNKYYQVFLEDKKIDSANVTDSAQQEYFAKIVDNFKENFSGLEGSDAQEYTTWKEHLYVMKQLGRLTAAQVTVLEKKLTAQSEGDFRLSNMLTYEELGMVMQPIKPVYVGNILSVDDNVDRRVYVKSSSFPLIPQLTRGMQIDKIRQGIEKFETEVSTKQTADGTPAFVRASFNTANKVGAVKNGVKVFDDNGDVVDNFEVKEENTLLLSRSNFRIQQDVPYSREKNLINIGTQERSLLFNDLLGLDISEGVTAESLMEAYNKNYEEIFMYNQEKLAEKLGLVETIIETPNLESLATLPTTEVFSKVAAFNAQLKGVSPIKKIAMQEVFAEEMGEDTLERANFINNNFNDIIKAIAAAKMNIFFDETQEENEEFKKCTE
jgi:hypothetical protein